MLRRSRALSVPVHARVHVAVGRPGRDHRHPDEPAVEDADGVVSVGQQPVADGVDTVELAALLSVTRAVFNMHEFINRN